MDVYWLEISINFSRSLEIVNSREMGLKEEEFDGSLIDFNLGMIIALFHFGGM